MSFKVISYLGLWWPICLVEQNHLCNLSREYHEEQFSEIILNLDQLVVQEEILFKRFLSRALAALMFVYAILVECSMGNIHLNLF